MSPEVHYRLRNILMGLGKAGLGLALMAVLVARNWDKIKQQLDPSSVGWHYLALGFAITVAATLLTFLRWYLLVRAQGLPFRVRDSLRIGSIGYFFNLLIPGAVGGDLVKVVLLVREQERRTVAVATVVIDRIVGMLGLLLLSGLVVVIFLGPLWATEPLRKLAIFAAILLAVTLVAFLSLFSTIMHKSAIARWVCKLPVLGGVLEESFGAMAVYRSKFSVIVAAVGMSVVSHFGFVMSLRLAMLGVADQPSSAVIHFMTVPLGLMVGAIPITPGGLGLAEGAMNGLFDYVGANGSMAIVMMLAFRVMQILTALLGMAYYVACRAEIAASTAAEGTDLSGSPGRLAPAGETEPERGREGEISATAM